MGFFKNIARMTAGALGTNQLSSQGGRSNSLPVAQNLYTRQGQGSVAQRMIAKALPQVFGQQKQNQLPHYQHESACNSNLTGSPAVTTPQTTQAIAPSITPRQAAAQIFNPQQQPMMNTNTIPQTPISPTAFSNQDTIQSVFGQANPGAFTRSIMSPLAQMTSQGYIPPMDPTNPEIISDPNAIINSANPDLQSPYGAIQ